MAKDAIRLLDDHPTGLDAVMVGYGAVFDTPLGHLSDLISIHP
jgi:hypothetical protein